MQSGDVAVGRFVYGRSYLDRTDAVPIDPVDLKLGRSTYRMTALQGMFVSPLAKAVNKLVAFWRQSHGQGIH